MKKQLQKTRSIPKQSDITISPTGKVSISFMWNDIKSSDHEQSNCPSEETPQNIKSNLTKDLDPNHHQLKTLKIDFLNSINEYKSCKMCPKECGFDRMTKTHPQCGGQDLIVGTWGLSVGDEPEISGVNGSGTILFSHCSLKCPSCHNPEMVSQGYKVNFEDVIDICYTLKEWGAENIQFLSPTVHIAKLIPILKYLKLNNFNLPIVLKSSGVENLNYLKKLEGLVDIYLPDFKYGPNSEFAKRSGFKNYFEIAKENILEMLRQTGEPKYKTSSLKLSLNLVGSATTETKTLKSGVLVRHVKAPIPESERSHIIEFFNTLDNKAIISITDNFVNLE